MDTFSHYEYDIAIDIGIKKFLQNQTLHRLVDQDGNNLNMDEHPRKGLKIVDLERDPKTNEYKPKK